MWAMLLLHAGAATNQILQTALFGADHVEDLAEMVALLVALDVAYFLFWIHLLFL